MSVDRAVKKSARVMERNIKLETPVKEGHLRRSIRARDVSFANSEVFNRTTDQGKEINYAKFVEYGTRFMAPRAMFRKGTKKSEEKIAQIFKQEGQDLYKSGVGIK